MSRRRTLPYRTRVEFPITQSLSDKLDELCRDLHMPQTDILRHLLERATAEDFWFYDTRQFVTDARIQASNALMVLDVFLATRRWVDWELARVTLGNGATALTQVKEWLEAHRPKGEEGHEP